MDIRSFFGKKTPEQKGPTKSFVNKKRLVISDSDDDEILEIPVVKKQKIDESQRKHQVKHKGNVAAAPDDFFGSSQVKKEHKPMSSKPQKQVKKPISGEGDGFSDEELFEDSSFLETLEQLDQKKSKKQKENLTPPKGLGLAEKLSSKKKVMSWKEKIADKSERKRPRSEEETQSTSTCPPTSSKVTPKREPSPSPVVTPVRDRTAEKHSSSNTRTAEKHSSSNTRTAEKHSSSKTRTAEKHSSSNTTPKSSSGKSYEPEVTTPISSTSSATPKQTTDSETAENADDTPSQKKKGNPNYWAYKNREGPKNLGSKEIPEGAPNCLEGLTFVISGVLDSIERDEAADLIKKYGGKVTSAISKKTNYLVKGEGCGEKKLETAEKFNTKLLDEEALLELIRSKPGKKSAYDIKVEKEHVTVVKENGHAQASKAGEKKPSKVEERKLEMEVNTNTDEAAKQISNPKTENRTIKNENAPSNERKPSQPAVQPGSSDPWTERYRPTKVKEIIGQQGDKSSVNKLLRWLKNWEKWNKPGIKAPFNKDDGSHLKAALLSGSPGVGKTTSATVCSKELGFSYVELNASDARSKKSIKEHVADILNNHTIAGITQKGVKGDKHVLIMDEVDGMAGNEDRGGVAELIQLIKTTRIPIICICNNRNHQKIRSLANYCFDLRFYKPRLEQVKGAMMRIAFKEGLKIPPPAMQKIIEGANNDIRQIVNHLCMWSAGDKSMTFDQACKDSDKARKDMNIGIFDIPRLFFSAGEETRRYTYADYSDLFFQDYQMTPLFIHENYVSSNPMRAQRNDCRTLVALSNAADSICFGDHVNTEIKMQNWSLLPTQAHFSAMMPGFYMRGGLSGMVQFPQVLGQTSKKNRCDGLLRDMLNHMILHVSTDKRQLGMEYLPLLKDKLVSPLLQKETDGVSEVVDTMNSYDLQRDDWDTVMELSTFSPHPNPAASLNTKTKAAFTRQYNKDSHMNPYALQSAAVKKKKAKVADGDPQSGDDNEGDDEDDGDAMIKQKKAPAKKAPAKKAPAKKPVANNTKGTKKINAKSKK